MSRCPGLHCPGCDDSGSSRLALYALGAVAAAEVIEWIADHAVELMVATVACSVLAVAAVVVLFRWAGRRDARHAAERPFLAQRCTAEVTGSPRAALPAVTIISNFYGADGEQAAARVIRTAITGTAGDAITEGELPMGNKGGNHAGPGARVGIQAGHIGGNVIINGGLTAGKDAIQAGEVSTDEEDDEE